MRRRAESVKIKIVYGKKVRTPEVFKDGWLIWDGEWISLLDAPKIVLPPNAALS